MTLTTEQATRIAFQQDEATRKELTAAVKQLGWNRKYLFDPREIRNADRHERKVIRYCLRELGIW